MARSKIEWTDEVWNPITGCTKVSQGCKHCFAETIANRFWATQYPPNEDGSPRKFTDVRVHPERLDDPLKWRKPRRVFVNSMSDLFHEAVPDEFIAGVWMRMLSARRHTFMVLTKRPDRMASLVPELFKDFYTGEVTVVPNVWLGVSVEDQATADERIPLLLQTPAAVRFVSYEPALGPVDFMGYLCCNTISIGDTNENRGSSLQGSFRRGVRNQDRRDDMEVGKSSRQSLDGRDASNSVSAQEGRELNRELFTSPNNVESETIQFSGSQTCLSSLQRGDSRGNDDQSQERDKDRQPSREFGVDDILRTDIACLSGIEGTSMASRSSGREEQSFEIDRATSLGNSPEAAEQGKPLEHSQRLRNFLPNGVENSQDGKVGISWLIMGGESGPGARPLHPEWARSTRDQCQAAGVPFFFKQWGEYCPSNAIRGFDAALKATGNRYVFNDRQQVFHVGKKAAGRMLDGRTWDEFPEVTK